MNSACFVASMSHILGATAHPYDGRSQHKNECLGWQQDERAPLAVEGLSHAVRPPMELFLNGPLEVCLCIPQLGPRMHLHLVHALTQRPLPLMPGVVGCPRESRQAQR